MKRVLHILWALLIAMVGGSQTGALAQKLHPSQSTVPVEGYELAKMGYPSRMVPGAEGTALYVEYWLPGEGRRVTNHYLQCVDQEYNERWFKPITKEGQPAMRFLDLHRMSTCVVVVGHQPDPLTKGEKTVGQFFTLEGTEVGGPRTLSNYKEPMKGYRDYISLSPNREKLLWLGTNPGVAPKERRYFVSVVNTQGMADWRREIVLPNVNNRYTVQQGLVDNKGALYLLVTNETPTGTPADTLFPPRLLRYDPLTQQLGDLPLHWGGVAAEVVMGFTPAGALAIAALVGDGGTKGLPNGAKLGAPNRIWQRICLSQFDAARDMRELGGGTWPLPDSLVGRYTKLGGAGFRTGQLLAVGNQLVWTQEEKYVLETPRGKQTVVGDVLLHAFNPAEGTWQWTACLPKNQRDQGPGRVLGVTDPVGNSQFLYLLYLTELGARGSLALLSVNRNTGEYQRTELAPNDKGDFMFFPERAAQVDAKTLYLLGAGEPGQNNYKLFQFKF